MGQDNCALVTCLLDGYCKDCNFIATVCSDRIPRTQLGRVSMKRTMNSDDDMRISSRVWITCRSFSACSPPVYLISGRSVFGFTFNVACARTRRYDDKSELFIVRRV